MDPFDPRTLPSLPRVFFSSFFLSLVAECDLSPPFLRPTPAADNAVGRLGREKAALCRAPKAGPRDSAVVSHERDLFREGTSPQRGALFFFSRGGTRNGVGAEKLIGSARLRSFLFFSLPFSRPFASVHLRCDQEGEKLFSPPPPAAKCLKYLTGFALFLGLCSLC